MGIGEESVIREDPLGNQEPDEEEEDSSIGTLGIWSDSGFALRYISKDLCTFDPN
jgi:hypothetical protein